MFYFFAFVRLLMLLSIYMYSFLFYFNFFFWGGAFFLAFFGRNIVFFLRSLFFTTNHTSNETAKLHV